MPITLKNIAVKCGVNISTVSRSLNGSYGVDAGTRSRVIEVAESMNYRRNRVAANLATGKSHTLGLIISDIRNPFFAEFARGVEDAAHAAGYDLVLCNSDFDARKQMHYFRSLVEKSVDGILMSAVAAFSREQREEITRSGVPILLLNRPPGTHSFSTLSADNFKGGRLAGEYLLSLGHRRIAHLTGSRAHGNLSARINGFLKALHSHDGVLAPIVLRGDPTHGGGYEMTKRLLTEYEGVTAIFAASDAIAFGAIRAVYEANLSIPEDISLIGFDNIEMADIVRPPLTTIELPKYEKGRIAVETLLKIFERDAGHTPEHIVLDVTLVERQSCRMLKQS